MYSKLNDSHRIMLKAIAKHLAKCNYNPAIPTDQLEIFSKHCPCCYNARPKILENLKTCPVFIAEQTDFYVLNDLLYKANPSPDLDGIPESLAELIDDAALEELEEAQKTIISFDKDGTEIKTNNKILDEVTNHYITVANRVAKTELKGFPFDTFILLLDNPGFDANFNKIYGIFYHEVNPTTWLVFTVKQDTKDNSIFMNGGITGATSNDVRLAEYFCNQTDSLELSSDILSANIGQYIKQLPRTAKHRPQHIIYIGKKKDFIKANPQYENKILRKSQLAHMVRGHWRKLWGNQKQGKDRYGNPIEGKYTWVVAHKRGKGELTEAPVYVVK